MNKRLQDLAESIGRFTLKDMTGARATFIFTPDELEAFTTALEAPAAAQPPSAVEMGEEAWRDVWVEANRSGSFSAFMFNLPAIIKANAQGGKL